MPIVKHGKSASTGHKSKPQAAGKGSFSEDPEDSIVPERLEAIFHGFEKTGKNGLAFTAPGKIALLVNDPSYLPALNYARSCGKEIAVAKFMWTPTLRSSAADLQRKSQAKAMVDRWEDDMLRALQSPEYKSIVLDNGTLLLNMVQTAIHGKVGKILPRERGASNEVMHRLYTMGHTFNKNIIWIHRTKEIWINNEPSGVFRPDGYKWAGNEVQATVLTSRKPGTKKFVATIQDSTFDASVLGEKFEGGDCQFKKIASALMKVDEEKFDDGVELW